MVGMRRSDLETAKPRRIQLRFRGTALPDPVYREFIDALFSMRLPVLGLGVAFVGICVLLAHARQDLLLGALASLGAILLIVRLGVMTAYRGRASALTIQQVGRWERAYAGGNYAFALLLAALNVRVATYHEPLAHLIGVSLVFGFGAGVVSRISVRPWICVPSLLMATLPTAAALFVHSFVGHGEALHFQLYAIAGVLLAFIAALSLQSVAHLYRLTVRHAVTENDMTHLAKRDALTGLGNRLLLRERFEQASDASFRSGTYLAVHCLDLDGFKPVNDTFGHPAGDSLLMLVAQRLEASIRSGDTVVRLGGDEFVVVQVGLAHASEAELFARRMIRTLSAPYEVDGTTVRISASIGIAAIAASERKLEQVLSYADAALYEAKNAGKGRARLYSSSAGSRLEAAA